MYLHGDWVSECSAFHGTDCACLSLFFRLGEVTLQDFKAAVNRHGSYRYHLKALDLEFGTVKEEVGRRERAMINLTLTLIFTTSSQQEGNSNKELPNPYKKYATNLLIVLLSPEPVFLQCPTQSKIAFMLMP